MRIVSPLASGNGAYVLHKLLEARIPGYEVRGYDARSEYFPWALRRFADRSASLVHTTPDYAAFVRAPGVPLVVTFHNYMLDPFMQRFSSVAQRLHYRFDLRWWTQRAVRQAVAITAVSRFTASLARSDLGLQRDIPVIYDGVDADAFSPGASRGNGVKVLFSGNLTRRKGAHLLPRIADLLEPDICILYTQGLRTRARLPEHPRLECLGAIPFKDMPSLYRSVDMLVSPTVREGFGLNVAEAMACGLPVVATDCSSLPELVDSGRGGYLCRLGDAGEFARRINELAASPVLRREMGQYNREKVEREFTLPRMVSEYRALFEQLLAS